MVDIPSDSPAYLIEAIVDFAQRRKRICLQGDFEARVTITGRKAVPGPMSESAEWQCSFSRNSDFGVIRNRGARQGSSLLAAKQVERGLPAWRGPLPWRLFSPTQLCRNSFNSCRRMVRPLSFKPMWQRNDERRLHLPFRFRGDNCTDQLRSARHSESRRTGLPQNQRSLSGSAKLIPYSNARTPYSVKGELIASETKRRPEQTFVSRNYHPSVVCVVESQVSLGKGATNGILTTQADRGVPSLRRLPKASAPPRSPC